ncbi:hypothetical protein SIO17_17840 [Pseudoalteromonas piscicida]|uniref:EF-hand domain-containing protein n=1 Tax=Pseudoalteromonas piscicida TaxID=43662 RepID=A0ABM6NJ02_PSEO7|nr:hypothetical protein [Pseudoalteromonas piscicida]ATD08935.1 hypothetical protein PPIS_a4284 [Pseudoalteromonas piscicida]WPU30918.1 hypothetical protein SIO17_17840 [Pseudoalteromonas piscicida]
MFKKSLLALALAGVSVAANAGTVATTGAVNISLEGNKQAGSSVIAAADLGTITIDNGAEYIVNDVFQISLEGAEFDTTVNPTATTTGAATFAFVDFPNATTARFRVSTANNPDAAGGVITFGGFSLKTGSAADKGTIKFGAKAISVNASIGDYDVSKATTVATFRSQLTSALTKLDGEVSTSKGRKEFTNSGSTLKDVLTVDFTDNSADVDAITFSKVTHVLKGDFSYAIDYDADKDGKLSATELASAFTVAGTDDTYVLSINDAHTELTVTQTAVGTLDDITVDTNVKGETAKGSVITAPQSFTLASTATNAGSTASVAIAAKDAGKWTLDGSNDNITFMPFDAQYAQSINVTNTGSVVGAINVTLTAGGMSYSKTLDQTAAAKSVTNISQAVKAFAAESGITGNAHINVVVNAPSANISVDAIYYHKADADRVKTH